MHKLILILHNYLKLLSAFSANGIVALKLEYLVKDLETQINNYLIELSGGRFQFNFILEGDKLSIKINDNGSLIDITALSAGELARVNAATLLAIRKLMMAIADTSINILFLDEITGTLDIDGKEKLISILQKEPMNTFLVSHDWSHPAIPSVTVVRDEETKNSR